MSKKFKKSHKGGLSVTVGLLLICVVLVCGIALCQWKQQLLQSEKEQILLQEQVQKLEQEQKEKDQLISDLEEKINTLQQAEEKRKQEEEARLEEAQNLNMEQTPAGTVVEESMVNQEQLADYFCAFPISDEVYQVINGKSYRENNNIGLDDLRYLKVLHYNFEHQIQIGELIVNAAVAEDFVNIFRELFEAEYEIQSMYLIDQYWTGDGDTSDTASIEVNNTSAFCYRQITGGGKLSNHAYGRAIDINPQQNPYVSYRSGSPKWSHSNANDYIARDTGLAHVITHEDLCYKIFAKYGFSWGGDWDIIKDYQHFEKEG